MAVRIARLTTVAATITLVACGQPLFTPDPPRPPVIPREPYFAPPASAAEIASVAWSHGSCLGTCPVYTASLTSSGVARWKGEYPERFAGGDTTTVDTATFRRVAERILDAGTFEWEAEQPHIVDASSLTLAVALTDGRVKRVTGSGGPHTSLVWALDSIAETLPWRREARPFEFFYRALVWKSGQASGRTSPAHR